MDAAGRDLRRVLLVTLAGDLGFTLLIPIFYLRTLGIVWSDDRLLVVELLLPLSLLKAFVLALPLRRLLQPIARWRRSLPDGDADGALLRRACRAIFLIPRRGTLVYAATWAATYFALTLLLRFPIPDLIPLAPRAMVAGALFSVTLFAAAVPFSYGVLTALLAPVAAELSLAARVRGVPLQGRQLSLRARLIAFGLCLTLAPTTWMSGVAYMAGVPTATIALSAGLVLVWGPACAALLAWAIAGPIGRVAELVRALAERGEVDPSERAPIFFLDEVGRLAEGVNEMVDALDQSRHRIRDQAEVERRRAAELQAVLDHMVEAVLVCDRERLRLANRAALEQLGLATVEEARERWRDLVARLTTPGGSGIPREVQPLSRALGGETLTEEQCMVTPRDEERRLRVTAAPIRDGQGAVVGAVMVSRDVTELRALDRLKEQFIRVAAHELKTPVTVMKGYAQLVLRSASSLAPSQGAALEAINRGADRIDAIVRDLLDVSQLYLGRWQLASEELDLAAVTRSAVDRSAARSSGRVRLGRAESARVLGDPRRLDEVHARLIDNALKFSPRGDDVEVSLTIEDAAAVVAVRDAGVGIPPDKGPRIFEPFYRAHTDTPHDHGGIGAGLYICKEIVERHGGAIWFASEEGKGSVFSFRLPLKI